MNNQKEHFFDRFRSKEETDNEKIFDDYIREKDTQVRFSEINNTINSLIDLPEDQKYVLLPKLHGDKDPFLYIARMLISASNEPFATEIVTGIIDSGKKISPINKLLWIFVSLAATKSHEDFLKQTISRNDFSKHHQTRYFLERALFRIRIGDDKIMYIAEIISMCSIPRDGVYTSAKKSLA